MNAVRRFLLRQNKHLTQLQRDAFSDLAERTIAMESLLESAIREAGEQGVRMDGEARNSFTRLTDEQVQAEAERMEKEGRVPGEIWEALGAARTMDGKGWRTEIDDSGMRYKSENGTLLSDIIDHEDLFRTYPQLRNVKVKFQTLNTRENGYYDEENNTIILSSTLQSKPESTLLHEIQHVIQSIDKTPRGASPEYWARREYETGDLVTNRLQEQYDRILNQLPRAEQNRYIRYTELERELERLFLSDENSEDGRRYAELEREQDAIYEELYPNKWFRDLLDLSRRMTDTEGEYMRMYQNTAGEIEARDTAARRNLTAEQRRRVTPKRANEDTVFAEGGEWQSMADYDPETASIKEQIEHNREMLNAMPTVVSVTVPTNLKNKDAAAAWASERLKSTGYRVDRQGYGEIYFSKKDIDKGLRYADTAEEKAALAALPQVLKRGVEIGDHENHKKRTKQTITFAAPVELNGTRGNMAVVINRNGSRYYAHRIVLPDGTAFKFSMENEDAARELYRGVTVSGSLADTTSAASEADAAIAANPSPGAGRSTAPISIESVTQNGTEVKTKFSLKEDSEGRKREQLSIIQESNAAPDDYHTWIRNVEDIRTLREALDDPEWAGYDEFDPDYTKEMAERALSEDSIEVFSSYPIKAGVFVTPSRMEAESYSGNGKIYSKTVSPGDVAWIDPTQGQFAPVENAKDSLSDRETAELLAREDELNSDNYGVPYEEQARWSKKGEAEVAEDLRKAYEGKSLTEDSEVYSYDFLTALPDMQVTVLPDLDSVRNADGRVAAGKVVTEGMKNARAVGTARDGKVYVQNDYTGRNLRIDNSSIRHGLNGGANRVLTNARLGAVIGEVVKNAVPINALNNRAEGVAGTYAMAAYAADDRGREFVAVVTVEQRDNSVAGLDVFDVTHAVSGRQKKGSQADTKSQGVYPIKATEISIADFINAVNSTHQSILSNDVLARIGETRNPNGDYTGQVKFSRKKDVPQNPGTSEQEILEDYVKRYGAIPKGERAAPGG